jgi:hypothetical protein
MAGHNSTSSMLKESLDEFIEAAKFCIQYSKTDDFWGVFKTGGCLGYPAGVLLFSIIDSIGSYFRNNKTFKISVDGNLTSINHKGWEHFKILNSKYFNQDLPSSYLKMLYNQYRNYLTHNSVLGKKASMFPSNELMEGLKNVSFAIIKYENGIEYNVVFMKELFELCKKAVELFEADIDNVVPESEQSKILNF